MKRSNKQIIASPLLLFLIINFIVLFETDGCQSCVFPKTLPSPRHHAHAPSAVAMSLRNRPIQLSKSFLGFIAFKSLQKPIIQPVAVAVGVLVTQRCMSAILLSDGQEEDNDKDTKEQGKEEKPMTEAMVATIGIYKNYISPLLPPACRFVPTCSQYGVQAIEEFGPSKGCILTAWRLLRCSPFGGKGYDPPKWPPVPYTYSSY